MFCENCGKKLEDDAKFCSVCGHPVLREEESAPAAPAPARRLCFHYNKPSTKRNFPHCIHSCLANTLRHPQFRHNPPYSAQNFPSSGVFREIFFIALLTRLFTFVILYTINHLQLSLFSLIPSFTIALYVKSYTISLLRLFPTEKVSCDRFKR